MDHVIVVTHRPAPEGWDGKPPGGMDHVIVVTHRPAPEGWDPLPSSTAGDR